MKRTTAISYLLLGALMLSGAFLRAADMTLEGTVTDAKCGAKHMMKDAAACTQACVEKGSDYALIVGKQVYTLKASSNEEKMELAKLAGKMAKVTGDVTGTDLMVKSVAMAKKS